MRWRRRSHGDGGRRARELFRICVDAAAGQTRPVMALHDCRMVNMFPTTEGAMAEFVAEMKDQEGRDGVLSLSLGHGFPWGDVADNGVKVLAVVDQDAAWRADLERNQLTADFTNGRDARKYWNELAGPLKNVLDDLGLSR